MIINTSQKNIFKYILHKKKYIYIFFISITISTCIEIIEPLIAKKIIDLTTTNNFQEIIYLSLFWFFIFLIKMSSNLIYKKYSLKHLLFVSESIQKGLFQQLLYKPVAFFREKSIGYIIARLIDDIGALEGMMLNNIIAGLIAIIEILIIFQFMFKISMSLCFFALLLKFIDFYINFGFPLKSLYKNTNEQKAIHSKFLQDTLSGILLIKSGNAYNKEVNNYKQVLNNWYDAWEKRDRTNYIRRLLSNFSSELSTMLIILVGALSIYYKWNTIGDIMAFLLFFQKLNSAIPNAINLIPLYRIAQGASERIYEFINEMENECIEINNISFKEILKGNIEFSNITLKKDSKIILNNISLYIPSNSLTVFVGKSGSGKTTIANLLLRFIKESSGYIYIDKKNINDYDILSLRNSIAYLTQESIIFNRSLWDNITYHHSINNMDEIQNLLIKTASYDLIHKLPLGMGTIIKSDSGILSGGEKQRVALIRELLKNAPIIIFDEATASVDPITEKIINKTILELSTKSTVIVITHKLEIAKEAKIIHVIKDGTLKESGNHNTLLKQKGEYYNLIRKNISED